MSTGRYAAWIQGEAETEGERPEMDAYANMPVREIMEGPAADDGRKMPENEGAEATPQPETAAMQMTMDHGVAKPKGMDDSSTIVPQDSAKPQEKADAMNAEPEKESAGNDRDSRGTAAEKSHAMLEDNSQPKGNQQIPPPGISG